MQKNDCWLKTRKFKKVNGAQMGKKVYCPRGCVTQTYNFLSLTCECTLEYWHKFCHLIPRSNYLTCVQVLLIVYWRINV